MTKFRVSVRTDRVGSKVEGVVELDDEELENLDDVQKDRLIFDIVADMGLFEWDYEEIEE